MAAGIETAVARLASTVVLWLAAMMAPASAEVPRRIVSLDLCTDQLLIELAPPERIAAVTHLAADASVSAIPDRARGIHVTHGAAEDVLGLDPDLVLAGPFGVSPTVDLLRRLKRNVVLVPLAQDLDGVRLSIRTVATAIGEAARGAAMIEAFDRRLASLTRPRHGPPPTAVIYQVGGVTSRPGSLADAALSAAGFHNRAGDYRLSRSGQIPLELLVAAPPDLIVLASAANAYRTAAADNLRHPVLNQLRAGHEFLELRWQLWLCGTPHIADAIDQLVAARQRLQAARP